MYKHLTLRCLASILCFFASLSPYPPFLSVSVFLSLFLLLFSLIFHSTFAPPPFPSHPQGRLTYRFRQGGAVWPSPPCLRVPKVLASSVPPFFVSPAPSVFVLVHPQSLSLDLLLSLLFQRVSSSSQNQWVECSRSSARESATTKVRAREESRDRRTMGFSTHHTDIHRSHPFNLSDNISTVEIWSSLPKEVVATLWIIIDRDLLIIRRPVSTKRRR